MLKTPADYIVATIIVFLSFATMLNAFTAWVSPSPYERATIAQETYMELRNRITANQAEQVVTNNEVGNQLRDIQAHLDSLDDDMAKLMDPKPKHKLPARVK